MRKPKRKEQPWLGIREVINCEHCPLCKTWVGMLAPEAFRCPESPNADEELPTCPMVQEAFRGPKGEQGPERKAWDLIDALWAAHEMGLFETPDISKYKGGSRLQHSGPGV